MDLRQLSYYVRIVELGSLTKAATVLRIAQPALGAQIRKLELEFGAQLLTRHSRGVEPTEVGRVLFEHAKVLLAEAENTKNVIHDLKGPPRGHVSLGLPPIVHSLPISIIKRCTSEYPEVSLTIVEEFSSFLVEMDRGWPPRHGLCLRRFDSARDERRAAVARRLPVRPGRRN